MEVDAVDWFQLANALTGFLVGVGVVIVGFIRKFRAAMKRLVEVHEQVTPKGGASIADKVAQIREDQRRVLGTTTAWLRASLDVMPQAMWHSDASGAVVWVNFACADMFGLAPHQMHGRGWVVAIHTEDREGLEHDWGDAVACKRIFDHEYRIRQPKTGVVILVRSRGNPVVDLVDDRLIGWSGQITAVGNGQQMGARPS